MRPPDFSILMDGGFKALYMDIPFPTSVSVTGYVWMVYYSRYGGGCVLLSGLSGSCGGDRTAIRFVSSLLHLLRFFIHTLPFQSSHLVSLIHRFLTSYTAGYDKNDLDIESFIELIDSEITALRYIASPNAIVSMPQVSTTLGAGGGEGNGDAERVRKMKKRSVEEVGKRKVDMSKSKLRSGMNGGGGDGGLDGLPERYGEV